MAAEAIDFQTDTTPLRPRWIQLTAAGPAFLLWTFLAGQSLIWCAGAVVLAVLGRTPAYDWRMPYLAVVCPLTLVCAGMIGILFLRAYQGRSLLWWHAGTFSLGVVFFALLGIVGD